MFLLLPRDMTEKEQQVVSDNVVRSHPKPDTKSESTRGDEQGSGTLLKGSPCNPVLHETPLTGQGIMIGKWLVKSTTVI